MNIGEIFNTWPNDLSGTNVQEAYESCWFINNNINIIIIIILWWTSAFPVVFNCGKFLPYSFFVILLALLSSSFIVSNVKIWR